MRTAPRPDKSELANPVGIANKDGGLSLKLNPDDSGRYTDSGTSTRAVHGTSSNADLSTASSGAWRWSVFAEPYTDEWLREMHPDVFNEGEEAQATRVSLLEGKWILFVCSGCEMVKQLVYRKIHEELGVNIIILDDMNSQLAMHLKAMGTCQEYIAVDMTPRPSLVRECIEAVIGYVAEKNVQLTAITTYWDDAVSLCARLQDAFGVPGNPPHAIDICHDKLASRCYFQEKGITTPRFCHIDDEHELQKAGEAVGFPAVIKPVCGAASFGVLRVNSMDELTKKYQECKDLMAEICEDGDLMQLYFKDAPDIACSTADGIRSMVMEQFLVGPECDVDVVLCRGKIVFMEISDDWEMSPPWFTELGHTCPTTMSPQDEKRVKSAVTDIVKVSGLTDGILHVEMKLTPDKGPVLIELNPRMAGVPLNKFYKEIYNMCPTTEQLIISSGIPSIPVESPKPKCFGSCVRIYAPKTGVVEEDIDVIVKSVAKKYPGVLNAEGMYDKESHVTAWDDGFPSLVAIVAILRPTPAEADADVKLIREDVLANLKIRDLTAEESKLKQDEAK